MLFENGIAVHGPSATPRPASSTFVLIVEGLDPERGSRVRLLGGDGHRPTPARPITTNEWVDRLAPKAAAVVALGTCATYGGVPAMKNNPTGAIEVADYLGWDWKSSAGLPVGEHPGLWPSPTTRPRRCSTWRCTIGPGAGTGPR